MKTAKIISGILIILSFISLFFFVSSFAIIPVLTGLLSGITLLVLEIAGGKKSENQPEKADCNSLYEENENLRKSLAQANASLEGMRLYISEIIPKEKGVFSENYVLMGIVFTPSQFMDKLNELTSHELSQRGLDFSVDISPSLPEKICSDFPRLALAVCEIVSFVAERTKQGIIHAELLSDGNDRMEIRISSNGNSFPDDIIEAAFTGRFGSNLTYSARTAQIMHGDLKLRNISAGISASLSVLINSEQNI